jgi:hypothetical protein
MLVDDRGGRPARRDRGEESRPGNRPGDRGQRDSAAALGAIEQISDVIITIRDARAGIAAAVEQ